MKTYRVILLLMLVAAVLLAGCESVRGAESTATTPTAAGNQETAASEAPSAEPDNTAAGGEADRTSPEDSGEDYEYEGDAATYYIDVAYAKQIDRYYTALSEQWDEGKYFENGLSALASYYYEGNPLDNVGFGFADLDNDGYWELIIGAILNAEQDPAVFEIWTLVNGEPVMLVQGGSRNRYILQYAEEDNMWSVANEASNGAANSAVHYLKLNGDKFEVIQAIIYDANADAENPWFMAYDMDWDVSNDEAIDESTALAIMEANRNIYTAIEYFPYNLYR